MHRCAFVPGGTAVAGGGRVDVIELETQQMEYGEMTLAYVVLRVPGETVQTQRLGEQWSIPGQQSAYTLEPLELKGDTAIVRSNETVTTVPNTGDPDEPSGEYDEVSRLVTRCVVPDLDCTRE